MEPVIKPKTKERRGRILAAFLLGLTAGAAAMFSCGLLYLRHNLIVRYDFPGLTADDFDDAFETSIPPESGWRATREVCSLPLASDGRSVYNWKLCHRRYARALMDDRENGAILPAILPCTISITTAPEDGHAVVSRLNTALAGLIFGGDARSVFRENIAPEQDALIRALASGQSQKEETDDDNESK